MTREAMVKEIEEKLGMSELDGIRHIDRPTWWLRRMFLKILENNDTDINIGCLKCELIRLANFLSISTRFSAYCKEAKND